MKRLKVLSEKCSGCRICQLVCSMVHNQGAFNPRRGLIRVNVNRNPSGPLLVEDLNVPSTCLQCNPAPCAECCPVDAFEKNGEMGIYQINGDICEGCGACYEACEFQMVVIIEDKAMKCDLCGGEPTCVRYCPTGALVWEPC